MLTVEQQRALSGGSASTALQAQLQAIADRNRDRQQLGLPVRPAPPGMTKMPNQPMNLDGIMWLLLGLM